MAKFELTYNHSKGYQEGIKVEITLIERPSKDDYQKMLDAIETLDSMKKYIKIEDKKETE